VIDEAVYDLRGEISEAATKLRISALNPHWTTTHVDHVEMTDEEVADQVGRADRFIEQLRDAITATVVDPASYVAGFSGSPRRASFSVRIAVPIFQMVRAAPQRYAAPSWEHYHTADYLRRGLVHCG
jgi:hypothetical protein